MVSRLSSQCDSSPRHSVSRLMMSGPGKIDLDCETGPQTFRISSQSSGDKERMRDFDGAVIRGQVFTESVTLRDSCNVAAGQGVTRDTLYSGLSWPHPSSRISELMSQ